MKHFLVFSFTVLASTISQAADLNCTLSSISPDGLHLSSTKAIQQPGDGMAYASTEVKFNIKADGRNLEAKGTLTTGLNVLNVEILDTDSGFKAISQDEFASSITGMHREVRLGVAAGWTYLLSCRVQ